VCVCVCVCVRVRPVRKSGVLILSIEEEDVETLIVLLESRGKFYLQVPSGSRVMTVSPVTTIMAESSVRML